jgi:hypothetical protein
MIYPKVAASQEQNISDGLDGLRILASMIAARIRAERVSKSRTASHENSQDENISGTNRHKKN